MNKADLVTNALGCVDGICRQSVNASPGAAALRTTDRVRVADAVETLFALNAHAKDDGRSILARADG